jgi:hypothetical protein
MNQTHGDDKLTSNRTLHDDVDVLVWGIREHTPDLIIRLQHLSALDAILQP